LSVPRDYLFFLDSTMARFWFKTERARRIVIGSLESLQGGRWVTSEERQKYRIRYSHDRFGQEIWWAHGGVLISPNFWQWREPVLGMHGYRWEEIDNRSGFAVISRKGSKASCRRQGMIEMVDIYATAVEMLGLKRLTGTHGISLV